MNTKKLKTLGAIVAIATTALLAQGCGDRKAASKSAQNQWTARKIKQMESVTYSGHTYILYVDGMTAAAMVHDPDCKCNG